MSHGFRNTRVHIFVERGFHPLRWIQGVGLLGGMVTPGLPPWSDVWVETSSATCGVGGGQTPIQNPGR